jgi:2-methylcitrate dehydratase PrpD
MASYSELLSQWATDLRYGDLPDAVVRNTELRTLDVVGLALAGHGTRFGRSVAASMRALHAGGPSRLIGTADRLTMTGAAFANGALSQALEFDDTHNESIVHMSGPSVATALALADARPLSGRDLIAAIAVGSEISCRIGSISPSQFHRRGFHPTGLFATFGTTWLAARLMGLDPGQMAHAAGIAGSFASGLLQCWVDGTQSKFLHPGLAAQSGILAASLGQAGATGPAEVLEGRFGLFASHLQDASAPRNYVRITDRLGEAWESQNASFKPFPVAHVIHPYIDAILRLRQRHAIAPEAVASIVCAVPAHIVGIVCEPVAEKRRPRSDSHGRVSLQYTLGEAMARGRIGKDAYQPESLTDPLILRLADVVDCRVDPDFPGPERFKGVVTVTTRDGSSWTEIEEDNRGSAANPMTEDDIVAKFDENAAGILTADQRRRLCAAILSLRDLPGADRILALAAAGGSRPC